jgi:ABC-type molybdate transport system permease subunit
VALFDQVEALEYSQAHRTAGLLLIIAFVVLALVHALQRRPFLRWNER